MVACRFIVIKIPFLSKSQNTFPGERGTLPKAGNHSPVKFLDLSSDFPGSHRGTTARLTRTYPPRLPLGPRPSRDPRPSSTGTIPAHFLPGPGSPKGTRRQAHRNALTPAPARPQSLPRPVARLHRNHPGSFSTRRQLPRRAPAARLTGTHSPRLPPSPNPSRDPRPSATETIPAHFHPAPAPTGEPPSGPPELTHPGSRPARIPPETRSPAPPEPSRLTFYPAPARRPRPDRALPFPQRGDPPGPAGPGRRKARRPGKLCPSKVTKR